MPSYRLLARALVTTDKEPIAMSGLTAKICSPPVDLAVRDLYINLPSKHVYKKREISGQTW